MSDMHWIVHEITPIEKFALRGATQIAKSKLICSWGLGDLSRLRDEARYEKRPFRLEESEVQEYIMTVEVLAEDVRRSSSDEGK
jgi:hypothetical protein